MNNKQFFSNTNLAQFFAGNRTLFREMALSSSLIVFPFIWSSSDLIPGTRSLKGCMYIIEETGEDF